MIFNRTQNDVDAAIDLRARKVQTFQQLTDGDIETLEKGTITINTLNRIENKQAELKTIFNGMGYWNTPIENKSWDYTQIFNASELMRIAYNTLVLMAAFFTYPDTPNTSLLPSYSFQDINAIEKILYDFDNETGGLVKDVKSHYRECGTFKCGE